MDLTAVEGLADLVAAETEAQRRQAFRQMRGHLAEQADQWRERLIEARALLEAGIDFSDEGDVPKKLGAAGARHHSAGGRPDRSGRTWPRRAHPRRPAGRDRRTTQCR